MLCLSIGAAFLCGVASTVLADHLVFVSDGTTVRVLDAVTLTPVAELRGNLNVTSGGFDDGHHMVVDSLGRRIFVSDHDEDFMVFDYNNSCLVPAQVPWNGISLREPLGIAPLPNGQLLITDEDLGRGSVPPNNGLFRLNADLSENLETDYTSLDTPEGVVYDAVHDRIYVADEDQNQIEIFNGTTLAHIATVAECAGDAYWLGVDGSSNRLFVLSEASCFHPGPPEQAQNLGGEFIRGIQVYDITDNGDNLVFNQTIVGSEGGGGNCYGALAVSESTDRLFAIDYCSNTVDIYDTESLVKLDTVPSNGQVPLMVGVGDLDFQDCNGNGIPDECDLVGDLTATGLPDIREVAVIGRADYFHFVNPLIPANELVGGAINSSEGFVKDVAVDPTTGLVYTVGIPLVMCDGVAIINGDQHIYLVDTDTGAGTALPQPTGFTSIAGLTFGSDGTFFGIGDGFFIIDKTTGVAQRVNESVSGFGMATSDTGQIYSVSFPNRPLSLPAAGATLGDVFTQVLQLHDPVTGIVISSVDLMIADIEGAVIDIAFGTGGILYGITGFPEFGSCGPSQDQLLYYANTDLIIIDPATGGITQVGPLDTILFGLGGPLPGSASPDCNNNGIPDECDPDCDGDGIPDDCDLSETEAPVITGCPASISGNLNTDCQFSPAPVLQVDATDNCTATEDLVITIDPADLSTLGAGETVVTITVTDEDGNSTSCTVTITLEQGDCDVGGAPQPVPCDPSTGGFNLLLTLLFHAPVCGMGCPLMIMLTVCGMLGLKARIRRKHRRS